MELSEIPDLSRFKKLKQLAINNNKLKQLPPLPVGLEELHCESNKLHHLGRLPKELKILRCDVNELTLLSDLPSKLEVLSCENNELEHLHTVHLLTKLKELNCDENVIPKHLRSTIEILNGERLNDDDN